MDTTVLQQKLAQQHHLLPSQQELLNRLLFQLAFNDFQHIGLVGAAGSGKSTLALALAELFCEQANVALLTGPVAEQELEGQLLQQWFGQRQLTPPLAKLMAEPVVGAFPLLLIVDNFSLLSRGVQQKLLQLDCLGFFMVGQPSVDMALNLSINAPTLQDAGLILSEKPLDSLAIAERFATSAGNMHLLQNVVVKADDRKSHKAAFWLLPMAIVLLLLLLVVLISWYWPVTRNMQQQTDTAISDGIADPSLELNSPELAKTADFIDSPEPSIRPELADSVEPIGISDHDEMAEPIVASELTDKSGLIDTSTLTAIAKSVDSIVPVVAAEPTALPAATSDPAEVTPVAEKHYQEQQLLDLPSQSRVLQLAVLSTERALQRFIQSYPDTEVVIYQRSWQGQLQWVILAKGDFPDVSSARQARLALAQPLRAAGPFIKPVAQVQQEIKALARLRTEPVVQD